MLFNGVEYTIQFWQGQELGRTLAIDTETTVKPFTETPDLVTFQVFDGEYLYYVDRSLVGDFLKKHVTRTLVFANAPFDIDVLRKFTGDKYLLKEQIENDKVFDINILYRLSELATTGNVPRKYSLSVISKKLLGAELEKDEDIRCNFEDFKNIPAKEIPKVFLEYGAKDVIATFHCFTRLRMEITRLGSNTNLSHHIQLLGALALNRMYKNGIGFDENKAQELLRELNADLEVQHAKMACYGFVKGIKGNQKAYNYVIDYLGIKLPKTAEGDYSMKESDLEKYKDNHFIASFLEYKKTEKTTFFIRKLTGSRVHPRYDLLKNTGRTGCSSPNIQQLPRDGHIRSMFKAEDGNTLLITDYSAIELATLAQHVYTTQGSSVMRDKINEGADLHKYYASVLFGVDEDKVEKWQRQAAKAANFGFPGGLGIETFIEFAKGYDITLTEDEAQHMKNTWFDAFPEMKQYMQGEEGHVWTLTGRLRADTTYCAEKNTAFQGLAADGAKIALYNLMDVGFKLVGFVHDEIITEVPENTAEEMRGLQEEIMVNSMSLVVPDVKISVESTISPRYCK
jgi:DNA polymerase-1